MIILIYFLTSFIFNVYLLVFYESILVSQYYSLKRYFKVVFTLSNYRRIIPIKTKLTRRNVLLFLASFPFCFVLPFFLSFLIVIGGYFISFPFEKRIERKYYKTAKEKLKELDLTIIGITGSYGKTTLRNYLACYLSRFIHVYSPKGNINTPKGIAKYINDTSFDDKGFLLLELGIDEIDGMDVFKKYLSLDYAFITSIGDNHLSTFNSIDNVYKGKIKIVNLLKNKKMIFLNKEDLYLKEYKGECIYFKSIEGVIKEKNEKGMKVEFDNRTINIKVYNDYVFLYLGALKSFSIMLNHSEKMFYKGISNIKQIHRRQEVIKIPNGYLINDSYNSNINSVKSSLSLLDSFDGISYIITSGSVEQGKKNKENTNILKKLLMGRNIIFVGNKRHILLKNASFNTLYIVKDIQKAYSLLESIEYNNLLVFPSGEKIHLI